MKRSVFFVEETSIDLIVSIEHMRGDNLSTARFDDKIWKLLIQVHRVSSGSG